MSPNPLSQQEIFDKVKKHLLTQMQRAYIADAVPRCRYREGDLKCAVGCLIPDAPYVPSIEGLSTRSTYLVKTLAAGGVVYDPDSYAPRDITEMLVDLQAVHDQTEPEQWSMQLNLVATKYGLNP